MKAERILMPYEGTEDEEEEYVAKIRNGKREIGTVFYFEKLGQDKNHARDIRFDSLDKYGNDILTLYEANDEASQSMA